MPHRELAVQLVLGAKVAPQTTLAYVNGVKMRVLFDTGSQKTFISKKAARKLSVMPMRSEKLDIKALGISEADSEEIIYYQQCALP